MNILLEEHQKFIEKLLKRQIEFVLVGGLAVVYYGYMRTTGDMDILLKTTDENKKKLLELFEEEKIFSEDLVFLKSMDFKKPLVFHIGEEPEKIDFLTQISGVSYDEIDLLKNFVEMDELRIPIIHINHLILSKIATNRAKDRADVEELQRIVGKNNEKK